MLESDAHDLVGGRAESGDAGLFAFQVRRLFDLGAGDQTKWRHGARGTDDHDIAAGGLAVIAAMAPA